MDRRLVVVGAPLAVMAATLLLFLALDRIERNSGAHASTPVATDAR
jgi:hypothetical protein